ncbi:nitroreductase family protein [Liquorilactobacillus satsumensis]|uniref:nitroreductase family protein n=1 Tax=Liquorilactobacillus TaxID=2767888 RepID=UPI0021C35FF6|nr:nitroreductase family protein [Liquorilactobacillus satsumensis]MCP9311719.1 nitroreductase family protein [Liquorilactobacillus satsumensis]MCP9328481.1 nitroreductase family protein [Liquorilactobacillus satsumensis]MCP9358852.1 nitroreductase family protein [Liquorilactobacillus satsumensis]
METKLLDLLEKRHSVYALGKDVKFSQAEIVQLVEDTVQATPHSFNVVTTRAAFLFGEKHDQFWEIVIKRLKSEVPNEEAYKNTVAKISSFKAAFGTILFFIDTDQVAQLEKDIPLYAANFKDWSEQALGSIQANTWVALAENGIGANLQHYNPIIDDLVKEAFQFPANWKLRAQLDFGSIEEEAPAKEKLSKNEQFRVLR